MRLSQPPRREPVESVTPMINVVFLLLIFFLMTATIAPPAPFEITPPSAETEAELVDDGALHLAADGRMGFGEAMGEAALDAAAAEMRAREAAGKPGPLPLRADAKLEAQAFARILAQLGERGVSRVQIAVSAP